MKSLARRDALIIFVMLLLAYCYVLPRWADWSQNSRINLVRALVEQGTTRIDAYADNTGDYALFEGHKYTDKAPGPSFVGLPVYAAALPIIDHPAVAGRLQKLAGGGAMNDTLNPEGTGVNNDKIRHFMATYLLTIVVVALPSAALGALLYNVLGSFDFKRGLRLLVTLGYGLATPAAIYAGNFYSHQFVAALLFGAFALLISNGQQSAVSSQQSGLKDRLLKPDPRFPIPVARALLFGLLCGYALISEYPTAIAIGALGIYALFRMTPRQLGLAVLGGFLPLALMAVYDLRSFGTIIPVGYSHSALWQEQHHTGFMSLTYPRPEGLWGLTFGTFRGLFVRAPWLLLGIAGFVIWWRRREWRALWWIALVTAVGLTAFYASSVMWWGGFGVGPRYIVPIIPFLAFAAAYAIQPLWNKIGGRIAMFALVLLSGALTWAEGLAHQSFPPDTIRQPWLEYTLPAWLGGDIARNLGMALGLRGPVSLLPLAIALIALIGVMIFVHREPKQESEARSQDSEAAQQLKAMRLR
jgi:hypothetical protein